MEAEVEGIVEAYGARKTADQCPVIGMFEGRLSTSEPLAYLEGTLLGWFDVLVEWREMGVFYTD